jgi:hypothetical protein
MPLCISIQHNNKNKQIKQSSIGVYFYFILLLVFLELHQIEKNKIMNTPAFYIYMYVCTHLLLLLFFSDNIAVFCPLPDFMKIPNILVKHTFEKV